MGYCIEVVKTEFLLKAENEIAALKELKKLAKRNLNRRLGLTWVDEQVVLDATSLEEAMAECRWDLHRDCKGADYDSIEFTGEKLGEDSSIFSVLAPFVENNSFIQVVGEDDELWRWEFKDGTLKETYPTW